MPIGENRVTKADLRFVDAAIEMHLAALGDKGEGVSIAAGDPAACDPVDVAALLVAAAIVAYKAWNSCLIGEQNDVMALASKVNLAPDVSLNEIIASRNRLAGALGEEQLRLEGGERR